MNYTFVEGITSQLYTIGYGKYGYNYARHLCHVDSYLAFYAELFNPYRGQLLSYANSKEENVAIAKHFSRHLPFWIESNSVSGNCSAIDTVLIKDKFKAN